MRTNRTIAMAVMVVFLFVAIAVAPATPAKAVTWNLVWSDEFNGTSVDTSKWVFEIGNGSGGWGNNELEYYRAENATVSGGFLNITAKRESYGGFAYTSARMKTQGKYSTKYGKVEARIKLPTGQGIWPAFWMLGDNIGSVGWPKCGEIDVMEHVNNNASVNGTIHWDYNGYVYYGLTSAGLDYNQYHTYTIEWDSSAIKWFVDGIQYCEANILNNINGTDEFHNPFFMLLNLAVGGNWPGSPDGSTVFPATMSVDYVRVYSASSGATPTPTPAATPTPTPSGATPTPTPATTPTPTPSGIAAWAPNTAYAVNQLCTYGGSTYKCLQAHTSLVGWEPPVVPALWQLQ